MLPSVRTQNFEACARFLASLGHEGGWVVSERGGPEHAPAGRQARPAAPSWAGHVCMWTAGAAPPPRRRAAALPLAALPCRGATLWSLPRAGAAA